MNQGKCEKCSDFCDKCSSSTNCQNCQQGYFLSQDGTCNLCDTEKGHFIKEDKCLKCKAGCNLCVDENTCADDIKCDERQRQIFDKTLKKCVQCLWDKQKNKCIEKCTENQLYLKDQMTCSQCFYYKNECLLKCPSKHFANQQNQCVPCHSTCAECKGPNSNQCSQCQSPNLLQDDKTCSRCESRSYFDTQKNTCVKCHYKCQSCNGPNIQDCLTCSESLIYSEKTNQCENLEETQKLLEEKQKFQHSECEDSGLDCDSIFESIQKEKSGAIYKKINDVYRFSFFNEQGDITATYLLPSTFQTLNKFSQYFIENNVLYIFTQGQSVYQTLDFTILESGNQNYYQQISYPKNMKYSCQISNMQVYKQDQFYYTCESGFGFVVYNSSFQNLFKAGQYYSISSLLTEKNFFAFDNNLCYNNQQSKIDFGTKQMVNVDLQNSIFIVNYKLVNFQSSGGKTSIKYSVDLGYNSEEAFMSNVITFGNIKVIFSYDYNQSKVRYFNAQNFSEFKVVKGDQIKIQDYLSIIQYQNIVFIGQNQYIITLINQTQINVKKVNFQYPKSYQLNYANFERFNFKKYQTFEVKQGSNQYITKLNYMYQFCLEGCQTCLNSSQCSVCMEPYYLDYSLKCVLTCPDTYAPDKTSGKCICIGGQIETAQNKCQCQDGYSFLNSICVKCPDNCQVCSSSTVCTVCANPYLLVFNKQCADSCPDTYEKDQNNSTCVCGSNKTETNNTCICNQGYILEGNVCNPCPQNCQICSSTTQCTTCVKDYYLDYKFQCGSECPPTYQKNSNMICSCLGGSKENSQNQCICDSGQVLENGTCVSCSSNCLMCSSSTTCTQCSNNTYLSFDNTCINNCQDTFLADDTNRKCYCPENESVNNDGKCDCSLGFYRVNDKCSPCPQNCGSCDSNGCQKCKQGFYFDYNKDCVSNCPETYHVDQDQQNCVCGTDQQEIDHKCSCPDKQVFENGKCVNCNSNCQQCSSSTTCQKCDPSYVLAYNQICLTECPQTYEKNSDSTCICGQNKQEINQKCSCIKGFFERDNNCLACISSCDVCSNENDCQKCSINSYLNYMNKCESDCPATFIKDDLNLICVCPTNFRLQDDKCVCDTGYSYVSGNCIKCPQNCDSCSSENTCIKCTPNYFLDFNNTCNTDCPTTYIKNSNTFQCQCGQGQTENTDKHICECNKGFFPNEQGQCQQCIQNCQVCQNGTECLKCEDKFFLDTKNNCVSKCPQTFQEDLQNMICVCPNNSTLNSDICTCEQDFEMQLDNTCKLKCSSFCESCSVAGECDVCQGGYYMNFDFTCINKCPETYIENQQTRTCDCDQLAELINVSEYEKKCVCPANQLYQEGNKCLSCISNCQKCSNGNTCDKCIEGFYLHNDGKCGNCDTKNGYFIKDEQKCGKCKYQCPECSDEVTCNVDLICNFDEKYDPIKKECIKCIYDLDNKKCVDKCTDQQFYQPDQMRCSQCFYLNDQCVISCPVRYFVGDKNICIKCHDSCLKCKGKQENECTECENPLQLQKNNQCLRCPEKEFLNLQNNKCEKCDQSCKFCTGKTINDCSLCEDNLKPSLLYKGRCIDDIQIEDEIDYKKKTIYSECQGNEDECKQQYETSKMLSTIAFFLNLGSLLLLGACLIFCPVINSICWYYIQIQQILGNHVYFEKANIYYMNVGFLRNHQIYNVFNLISFNSLQKDQDLLLEINKFSFLFKLQNLYNHFLQNFFYQLVSFSLLLCLILIFFLLRNKYTLAYKVNNYINLNMLIRYFMIAVNCFVVYTLFVIKNGVALEQGNIAIISIVFLIYILLQIFSIFILKSRSIFPIASTVRVLQYGIDQNKTNQFLFWQIFEVRKIVCILIQILYINGKGNGFIILSIFAVFTIYLVVSTPFKYRICQVSAIFTEFTVMLLLILFELMTNRQQYSIDTSTAQSIAISYIALSLILSFYYIGLAIHYIIKYLKELRQKSKQNLGTNLQDQSQSQAQISSIEMNNIQKSLIKVSWKQMEHQTQQKNL
ncbi:transmembrane protein, putative (macronuclear) [Tetrahymena thermophila SB210]|uniref:Transmembrane protein, putative n=1 Tax=Tetrahymena thermophila (strain SB210) TaxID=312017 RepID=Q23AK2_TETTS|nr:transmembrane protein, putative [Tetrahymena thermophila SB210]EAR93490.2 transmembrane protein, putative [Tetrahymena thermophila SB210]|eukprot:XP_001013735.2 transmembrane protein, putative [Tetrahymena thermophila SB210]